MVIDRANNDISCDPHTHDVTGCPSCTYRSPEGAPFSICPRCGIIVAKYFERKQQETPPASPVTHDQLKSPPRQTGRIILTVIAAACLVIGIGIAVRNHPAADKTGNDAPQAQSRLAADLLTAVQKNDAGRVQRLLFWGGSPNVAVNGRLPIEEALLTERIEIAKLLVEKGARIPQASKGDAPSLIQECIQKNLILSVSYLLGLHIPVDDLTPKGYSPLIQAAAKGHIEMVKMLIAHGKSVNTRDRNRWSPLLEAARVGNSEMVRFLIEHGADVNARGQFGYTPLMWGIKNNDIVAMLIDAGADINARSDNNNTPLHSAVSSLNLNAVKVMIEKGADVSAKDDRGVTPLKITTFHRNPLPDPFPEMAVLLKRAGATE